MLNSGKHTQNPALDARRSETLLDFVESQSPVIFYIADPERDGCFSYVSTNVKAITGYSATSIVANQRFRHSKMHPEDLERYRHCLQSLERAGDSTLEYRLRNSAGVFRWFRDHLRLNHDGAAGPEVVGCMIDITSEKEMEKALRKSDERFRRLFEAYPMPVGITRADDGAVIFESPAAKALFGRAAGPGTVVRASDYFVNPDDRRAYLTRLRHDGAVSDYELHLKKADNTPFWGLVSARLIEYQGEDVIVSSVYDMTERRSVEAEIARQREALHQSEKLSALGSLLAGVAHELNNPLSVVVGQALLLEETATDEKVAKRAAKIGVAAEKCSRIVRTFLAMARQQPAIRTEVKINEIVEATLEVTGYSLRTAGIEVELDIDPDLPPVWADADQLNQVVSNLIVNAQQAMAQTNGPRRLRIASVCDEKNGMVLLSVKDNGPGIPDEIRSRIFEPFFTTKDVGAGTGIGLAVCHRIVESMQGKISVQSRRGEGATFRIALPMTQPQATAASSLEPAVPEAQSCRVLVIDDEADVTRMLSDILTSDGHEVKAAASGKQALHLLSRHEFDVILSDLRMPNMDGPRLYDTLKKLSPKLVSRVAFITGDTFSPSVSQFFKDAGRPYVQKPFSPNEVRELVVKVLANQHIDAVVA